MAFKARTKATEESTVDATVVPEVTNPEKQQVTRYVDEIVPEVLQRSAYDPDVMRTIESFEEAMALADAMHDGVEDAAGVMGDGFAKLTNKRRIVGLPCIFMEWNFAPGDFGHQFVYARVIVQYESREIGKYIIVDGSTGIAEQLAKYTKDTGRTGGLKSKYGLRESEYDIDENGQPTNDKEKAKGKQSTFYIDTAV